MPMYVTKKDKRKPLVNLSLKKIKDKIATNIGAELTIIVALDTDVISMLKCQRVKSVVNASEANAAYKIVFLFLTLKKNFLLSMQFSKNKKGKAKNILQNEMADEDNMLNFTKIGANPISIAPKASKIR